MPELLGFSDLAAEKEGQPPTPEQETEFLGKIKNKVYECEEERDGDQLSIEARMFKHQTAAEVGTLIFAEFDSDENVDRIDTSGNKITITFIEPVDGIQRIEYSILE